MLEKYNRYKVLKIFLDLPLEQLRLRQIARLAKLSPPSIMEYLKEFEKKGLIRKTLKDKIPIYTANRDSSDFILYNKISIIFELNKSGLIDFLWNNLAPQSIILYGSFSKGESIENSDIDIFILGKEKNLEIEEFEAKLGRKIHILFKDSFKKLPNELKNNLLNGIILKGYVKAF